MTLRTAIFALALAGIAGLALAQGIGVVGYDPEIGTVFDGIVHDIRPTVSADRRYVQLDVGSGMSVIIRIDNFQVVTD